jgi:hypothetical protein
MEGTYVRIVGYQIPPTFHDLGKLAKKFKPICIEEGRLMEDAAAANILGVIAAGRNKRHWNHNERIVSVEGQYVVTFGFAFQLLRVPSPNPGTRGKKAT